MTKSSQQCFVSDSTAQNATAQNNSVFSTSTNLSQTTYYSKMRQHWLLNRFKKEMLQLASSRSKFTTVAPSTFFHNDLTVERATECQVQAKPMGDDLPFGVHFSDHMLEVKWSRKLGWAAPKISPLHNLILHPGTKVFHYAFQLFEGMKAYRGMDNKIRIFRPLLNMQRMNDGATRASLPNFDGEELLKCIVDLIGIDHEWVPYSTTSSLYIRPTLIGTEPTIGVADTSSALLFVLIGPTGPYFRGGRFHPIALYADPRVVRSWPGGVGAFKMGSNYAPTVLIGKTARSLGCQQVLWLFGKEELLTEVGTMNIFVYWINENQGLILPGITRRSLLELAHEWNEFKVTEGHFGMNQIRKAIAENRLLEMFGTGTASVISPVDRIVYNRGDHIDELKIPIMERQKSMMHRLHKAIYDIQYGRLEKRGWMRIVPEDDK